MANAKGKRLLIRSLGILLLVAMAFFFFWVFGLGTLVPNEDVSPGRIVSENGLNILIVGNDENQALGLPGRADTIIVAHIDLDTPSIFFLSIPRDTLVDIQGYAQDKLNHAFTYGGVDLLRSTTEELLNVPIHYYAVTDFDGFESIVDVLGGVDIEVDKRMYYQTYDGLIDIEAGLQHLNGEQALQYVRFRQDELGDITRVSRQQNFLKALIEECTSRGMIRKLPQLLVEVAKMVDTDMPYRYMIRLGLALRSVDSDSVSSATLPGDFATINGISYWEGDSAAIQKLIEENFGDEQL